MLETERLILQDYREEDFDSYFKLRNEKKIWIYSSIEPSDDAKMIKNELLERIAMMRGRKFTYGALFLRETGEYIGEAGVISYHENEKRAVIGYNLLPEFWHKGYASEIIKSLISFLFEQNKFINIEAMTIQNNLYSCRLLEYTGFKKSHIIDNYTKINNQLYPVCCYTYIRKA